MQDHYRWEFWIDVGGTFTDCFAHTPEGHLLRHKLLSSGITPGRIGSDSDPRRIFDPARCADPAEFWVGYRIRIQEK